MSNGWQRSTNSSRQAALLTIESSFITWWSRYSVCSKELLHHNIAQTKCLCHVLKLVLERLSGPVARIRRGSGLVFRTGRRGTGLVFAGRPSSRRPIAPCCGTLKTLEDAAEKVERLTRDIGAPRHAARSLRCQSSDNSWSVAPVESRDERRTERPASSLA